MSPLRGSTICVIHFTPIAVPHFHKVQSTSEGAHIDSGYRCICILRVEYGACDAADRDVVNPVGGLYYISDYSFIIL